MTRAWAALVALLLTPILALGSVSFAYQGTTDIDASCDGAKASPPSACELPDGLAPASAFTGPDGVVDDPTTTGRITRRMLNVLTQTEAAFGKWPWGISCWDAHAWNPNSDHPRGRACDFTVGRIGSFPNAIDRATGWRLAHWARANADVLGIRYVIFDGRIWSSARALEGWQPYDGGGVYNPGDVTGGHLDHVHLSCE